MTPLEQVKAKGCDHPNPSIYPSRDPVTRERTYICRCIVCGRCGHHTGNSTQGHYWALCQVWLAEGKGLNGSVREFHHCCPGNCELEENNARTD